MSTLLDMLEQSAAQRNLPEAMRFQSLLKTCDTGLVRVARAAAHVAWESEGGNGPTDGSLVVLLEALEPLLQESQSQ